MSKGTPMTNANPKKRELIEGRAAVIVIDIQKSTFAPIPDDERSIAHMPDYAERMARTKVVIDKAREKGIPVVFIQEIHRANQIDFGRELDGDEEIHCLDSNPLTDFAEEELGMRPDDYRISKRRYSAFYGTDLEILLRGLKAETLILTGGLTDVCVHYTFVDGHQGDYFCRVVEDCVAGSSIEAHNASLKAMEYLQHGAIRSIDEVLGAMDQTGG
ncbi:cysteine hydrolase family protein [Leisingera sp. McT4-56]|uniref:cysteine hydrolase family protein n=1 Tax=Leisingera sp. McT4-56 TaxID=2881255 RepID=UPI001CF80F7F|nr:cysteine hydrolase [Leisingera sp. McT4-56]MCB4457986.1 cysteine hydrolase [Leisingera sp. McT4-56]